MFRREQDSEQQDIQSNSFSHALNSTEVHQPRRNNKTKTNIFE